MAYGQNAFSCDPLKQSGSESQNLKYPSPLGVSLFDICVDHS